MHRLPYHPSVHNAFQGWWNANVNRWAPNGVTFAWQTKGPPAHVRHCGYNRRRQFEDWLWEQGFRLVQDNREIYIEAMDEMSLSMFALKYT